MFCAEPHLIGLALISQKSPGGERGGALNPQPFPFEKSGTYLNRFTPTFERAVML